ncbi:HAD family hydrolase [Streptomyces paludis]|uniref:Phosphoglycolate phosphatase n=1 Tax=Streptomyces paludis TaxID=2282738 RepID=A0A345HVX0_9ACTN|nr:HAD hydrolase-like protein [Streptomyces paludis]AXG80844.1 phosphoglycolate phosphatase [Streptomyces paludis]
MILVLWDIDRTLLYVGDIDRLVYREVFESVVGREPEVLPRKGTGITMPLAVRELLLANSVPPDQVDEFTDRIVDLLPKRLGDHRDRLRTEGRLMPGAVAALTAVQRSPQLVPSVVTGNLQESARIKLEALGLVTYVDIEVGGYASDNPHRPALVSTAQRRAGRKCKHEFNRGNTVIIGDSLQDVRTGVEGGAHIIAVASGTTSAEHLAEAGADHVIADLTDVDLLLRLIAKVKA